MPRIHGVGPRIAARIVAMGFARPDGKPDVRRFARAFDYDKTLVYEWCADRRTPTRELDRLCLDLQLTRGWLLYEEGVALPYKPPVPIGGGSAGIPTPHVVDVLEFLSLIRHRFLSWARLLLATGCPA